MHEVKTLVCMRLADMQRVHPKQDESRVCSVCGSQVGIYPSGQRIIKAEPWTVILCNHCYDDGGLATEILVPGAIDEPWESVRKK